MADETTGPLGTWLDSIERRWAVLGMPASDRIRLRGELEDDLAGAVREGADLADLISVNADEFADQIAAAQDPVGVVVAQDDIDDDHNASRFSGSWARVLVVLALVALAVTFAPVDAGHQIGMTERSCGSVWQAWFFPRPLPGYVPALNDECQRAANDRAVLALSIVGPFVLLLALRALARRLRIGRPPGPATQPQGTSADAGGAFGHLAPFVFVPVLPALLVFGMSRDRRTRRHAAEALDVQLSAVVLSLCTLAALLASKGGGQEVVGLMWLAEMLGLAVLSFVLGIRCLVGAERSWWGPTLIRVAPTQTRRADSRPHDVKLYAIKEQS